MHKLLQASAWVMALLLAVGMIGLVGCGDDDDDDDDVVAALTGTTPADGATAAANTPITMTFDNDPGTVTVNGAATEGAGKTRTFTIPAADAGQTKAYAVSWDSGDASITLTITAIDDTPPTLTGSDPVADGDEGVEYEGLEEITISFDEALDTVKSRAISLSPDGGAALSWSVSWADGDATAVLSAGKGATLTAETTYVIEGNAVDLSGNETPISITFTTRAKE